MSVLILQQQGAGLPAGPAPGRYQPRVEYDWGTRGGWFAAAPRGVILHGSRGNAASRAAEFDATRRYAASGIDLGWNLTCGEDAVSLHLPADAWGWNARAASGRYLAVEFAQPNLTWDITEAQVRAFCWWVRAVVLPRWPGLPLTVLPTHAELDGTAAYGGYVDGKSDVYGKGDGRADALRAQIIARLGDRSWSV